MTYTHGHAPSVLRSHRSRTVANSAAYLRDELRPGLRVLDVGCGPGTITLDLARAVAPGEVIGVDTVPGVLDDAAALAAGAADATSLRLSFQVADVGALPFEDASFDVVHAHQVLQHLADPVAALREMRRVTRPGGVVAVRDVDYATMAWAPDSGGLSEWLELYREVARADGGEPDAGRYLLGWALDAGFDGAALTSSASAWSYSGAEAQWWAQLWSERAVASAFADHAREHGLADDVLLEEISEAWLVWGEQPGAWFGMLHGELLARV